MIYVIPPSELGTTCTNPWGPCGSPWGGNEQFYMCGEGHAKLEKVADEQLAAGLQRAGLCRLVTVPLGG